jgi:hypothetical protein
MNASSMNGAGTSGGGAGGGGLPMGVPVMGGGGGQPMGMVPNTQGIMAQGKPGAPNQNVLDAVKKVGSSIHRPCNQCSGSEIGPPGSASGSLFVRIRILPSASKKMKNSLISTVLFCYFFMTLSLRSM